MYRIFLSTILCFPTNHVSATVLPNNTRIDLVRTRHVVRMDGEFLRPSTVSSETFERSQLRPWLQFRDCGNPTRGNEYYFVPATTNMLLDVSDMVMGRDSLLGICLSYESSLSQTLDSVLYLALPETNRPALILEPLHVTQYALDGVISYGPMMRGGTLVARVGFQEPSLQVNTTREVIFDPFGDSVTSVPTSQLEHLANIVRSIDGLTINYIFDIRGPDCYNRLINSLPNLHFGIISSEDGNEVVVADLVFFPEDYVVETISGSRCAFDLQQSTLDSRPLVLTGRLLSKLDGFHFDYVNNRIGFFDSV